MAGLGRIIKAVALAVAIFGFIYSLSALIHLLETELRYPIDTLWTIYRLILGIIIVYISWILYKMGGTKKEHANRFSLSLFKYGMNKGSYHYL